MSLLLFPRAWEGFRLAGPVTTAVGFTFSDPCASFLEPALGRLVSIFCYLMIPWINLGQICCLSRFVLRHLVFLKADENANFLSFSKIYLSTGSLLFWIFIFGCSSFPPALADAPATLALPSRVLSRFSLVTALNMDWHPYRLRKSFSWYRILGFSAIALSISSSCFLISYWNWFFMVARRLLKWWLISLSVTVAPTYIVLNRFNLS